MKKIKLRSLFIFNPALRSRVVATVRRYTIKLNKLKEKAK